MSITTAVVSPSSRGSITIDSNDPLSDPIIDPALLKTDFDKAIMVEAVKKASQFLTASVFDGYIVSPVNGLENATTDEDLTSYVMSSSATIYHPIGTAAMSPKEADFGVVDPDLLLKKVSGVRVVDASIFVSNTEVMN
jgi:choline dehydrogenase-like flavoprotein